MPGKAGRRPKEKTGDVRQGHEKGWEREGRRKRGEASGTDPGRSGFPSHQPPGPRPGHCPHPSPLSLLRGTAELSTWPQLMQGKTWVWSAWLMEALDPRSAPCFSALSDEKGN